MDRGARQATVHGVTKSPTRLDNHQHALSPGGDPDLPREVPAAAAAGQAGGGPGQLKLRLRSPVEVPALNSDSCYFLCLECCCTFILSVQTPSSVKAHSRHLHALRRRLSQNSLCPQHLVAASSVGQCLAQSSLSTCPTGHISKSPEHCLDISPGPLILP